VREIDFGVVIVLVIVKVKEETRDLMDDDFDTTRISGPRYPPQLSEFVANSIPTQWLLYVFSSWRLGGVSGVTVATVPNKTKQ